MGMLTKSMRFRFTPWLKDFVSNKENSKDMEKGGKDEICESYIRYCLGWCASSLNVSGGVPGTPPTARVSSFGFYNNEGSGEVVNDVLLFLLLCSELMMPCFVF